MALDLRNIGSRANYCDTYSLYASESIDGNSLKIKEGVAPLARFHSKDVDVFRWERESVNGIVSTTAQFKGRIETMDDLSMARPDMFVESEDGTLFIVEAPIECDNDSSSTSVSRRPRIKYRLTLRGMSK